MKSIVKSFLRATVSILASRILQLTAKTKTTWTIECFDASGKHKWNLVKTNLTVDVGLTDKLEKYFRGSNYTAAWYIGLMSASPIVAASNTMASHGGWAEVISYNELSRPAFQPNAAANKGIDNVGSIAEFTVNAAGSIGGAFLTTSPTKGGTAGILYGALGFGSDRDVGNGDVLRVTVSITEASG